MNLAEWATIVFLPLAVMSDCSQLKSEFVQTRTPPMVVSQCKTNEQIIKASPNSQSSPSDDFVEFIMVLILFYGLYALPRDIFRRLQRGHYS